MIADSHPACWVRWIGSLIICSALTCTGQVACRSDRESPTGSLSSRLSGEIEFCRHLLGHPHAQFREWRDHAGFVADPAQEPVGELV